MPNRRDVLTSAAALAGASILPFRAGAQGMEGDRYPTNLGELVIHPVSHASFVMQMPGAVLYADPVGAPTQYDGLPRPQIVLLTHEHQDHYNAETLTALVQEDTILITNPAVHGMLPEALRARATSMKNGDSLHAGAYDFVAIPAYNTTEARLKYHPKGRDNGYVITVDGKRVYVAGDTEDIPEMRALTDIHIAFVPMNLPYTMDVDQAASAVNAFKPDLVYPYHYKGSDIDKFAELVTGSKVVRGDWYPA